MYSGTVVHPRGGPGWTLGSTSVQNLEIMWLTLVQRTLKFGFLKYHSDQFRKGFWDGYGDHKRYDKGWNARVIL